MLGKGDLDFKQGWIWLHIVCDTLWLARFWFSLKVSWNQEGNVHSRISRKLSIILCSTSRNVSAWQTMIAPENNRPLFRKILQAADFIQADLCFAVRVEHGLSEFHFFEHFHPFHSIRMKRWNYGLSISESREQSDTTSVCRIPRDAHQQSGWNVAS